MNLHLFLEYVRTAKRGRSVMARILVNAMGGAAVAPIDISEFRKLSGENIAMVNSFLDWTSIHLDHKLCEENIQVLKLWFTATPYQIL